MSETSVLTTPPGLVPALPTYGAQPVWATLNEARARGFTGEIVFGVDPAVVVYLDDGVVYYAERRTDPPLGRRLVDAGVIDEVQLERGTVRWGETEHLGRMFERDSSIDRDVILVMLETATQRLVTELANTSTATVSASAYALHPSGIHRWFVASRPNTSAERMIGAHDDSPSAADGGSGQRIEGGLPKEMPQSEVAAAVGHATRSAEDDVARAVQRAVNAMAAVAGPTSNDTPDTTPAEVPVDEVPDEDEIPVDVVPVDEVSDEDEPVLDQPSAAEPGVAEPAVVEPVAAEPVVEAPVIPFDDDGPVPHAGGLPAPHPRSMVDRSPTLGANFQPVPDPEPRDPELQSDREPQLEPASRPRPRTGSLGTSQRPTSLWRRFTGSRRRR